MFKNLNHTKEKIDAFEYIKINDWDFHGDPEVKNPACNARDSGLIPGWGTKIPHATEQLSLHTSARESMCHNELSHMP